MDNLQNDNIDSINDDWTILSDIGKKRFEIKKNKNIIDKSINDSITSIEDDLKFEQLQPKQIEEIDLIDIKNANALASINQDIKEETVEINLKPNENILSQKNNVIKENIEKENDYVLTPIKNNNLFDMIIKNFSSIIMYFLLFVVPLYVSYEVKNIPSVINQLNKESLMMKLVYEIAFFSIVLYSWSLFQSFIFGIEEFTKKIKISIIKTN